MPMITKRERQLMEQLERNSGKIQILEKLARRSLPLRNRPNIVQIGFTGRWRDERLEGDIKAKKVNPIGLPDGQSAPTVSLSPAAGKCNATLASRPLRAIGINLLGLPTIELNRQVDMIIELQSRKRDFLPLFLTDSYDFSVFMKHGSSFEYVPAEHNIASGTLSYQVMKNCRIEQIRLKWGLADIIDLSREQPKQREADQLLRITC